MTSLFHALCLAADLAAADTTSLAGTSATLPASPPGLQTVATPAPAVDLRVHAMALPEPIHLDGVLSERIWNEAPVFTRFVQKEPVEGAAVSQRTEVRVVHDGDALYVGARLLDSAPDSIVVRLARRDDTVESDLFGVYLDPYHDRRSGYYFMVNAAGTLYDGTLFNDDKDDKSWDAVWQARVHVDPAQGWSAEMRIPLSQLRFHRRDPLTWGINFVRKIARAQEEDYAAYTPRKESGFVSRFPELVGPEGLRPAWPLELLPYASTQGEFVPVDPGDPFHDGSRQVTKAGLDLRAGIGRGLTLNGTVNPDFGQVEVDPDQVNLTEFETFFEEKRPFFTEGAATFGFGREGAGDYWDYDWDEPLFFYSRRIGRAPQGRVPRADYEQVPEQSTILAAGKLLGQLAPGTTLGTLHALTSREDVQLWNDGVTSETPIEPQSYYGVARLQSEFWHRRAGLGLLGTWATRYFTEARLPDAINGTALFGGVDGWLFLDRRKVWVISGWSGASRVSGTTKRMIDLQRTSARYFQRPDADHVSVDSSATSLAGYGHRFWLNKQRGAFRLNTAFGVLSPGLELNDLGFQRRADWINAHVGMGYRWSNPSRSVKYQSVKAAVYTTHDFGGVEIARGVSASGYTERPSGTSLTYWGKYDGEALDPRLTRGGPLALAPARTSFGLTANAYTRKRTYYFADLSGSTSPTGSWDAGAYVGGEWKPSSSFTIKWVPGLQRIHNDAQFVTSISDASAQATYGRRYVFGVLDQTDVSSSVRLNWLFQPALSLQGYLSPYVSAVSYREFKSLAKPRSYEFDPYPYTGDPSFIVGSLKSNVVLRWEYRPGSACFLVWTHGRSAFESGFGEFLPGRTLSEVLTDRPENVILLKVTYHLGD